MDFLKLTLEFLDSSLNISLELHKDPLGFLKDSHFRITLESHEGSFIPLGLSEESFRILLGSPKDALTNPVGLPQDFLRVTLGWGFRFPDCTFRATLRLL